MVIIVITTMLTVMVIGGVMLKNISAQKARQNFGELMDEVRLRGDRYIVNRGTKPLVAVIPVEEYIAWEKARERFYQKILQIRKKNQGIESEKLEREIREAVEATR
jgi:prevent-host-death family protein